MTSPRFSILLPTKNRSEIVAGAIESALAQTFRDFELIISDNDDSDHSTRTVVERFDDSRIRYFRTSGKLSMHENWEFALTKAIGENVLVLEDKMRLVENALQILDTCLNQYGPAIFSYDVRFTKESIHSGPRTAPRVVRWSTLDAISEFCNFSQRFFNLHPKALDSCAPMNLFRQAKESSPTGSVFSYICPDYSSGFLLLSQVDEFYYIDAPLLYVPNNWMGDAKYSNGQGTLKKTSATKRFISELPITIQDIQRFAPVKCEWLWLNMVLYDFATKFKKPGFNPQINWVKYHAFCLITVVLGKRIGADMSLESRAIRESLATRSLLFNVSVGCSFATRVMSYFFLMVKHRFDG